MGQSPATARPESLFRDDAPGSGPQGPGGMSLTLQQTALPAGQVLGRIRTLFCFFAQHVTTSTSYFKAVRMAGKSTGRARSHAAGTQERRRAAVRGGPLPVPAKFHGVTFQPTGTFWYPVSGRSTSSILTLCVHLNCGKGLCPRNPPKADDRCVSQDGRCDPAPRPGMGEPSGEEGCSRRARTLVPCALRKADDDFK